MSEAGTVRVGHETFSHQADIGVRGFGPTPEIAFQQAALALTAAVTEPASVAPAAVVEVDCSAPDLDLLLVDWLNALIYEMAVRHWLFARFEVVIDDQHLQGRAWGEPVDAERHQSAVEPKGATLTELRVEPSGGGWLAQCVVDV